MGNSMKARFYFELENGSPLVLTYQLQDNSLTPRWIEQVRQRNSEPNTYLDLKIANKTSNDIPELMKTLNGIVKDINSYYDKQLPFFTNTKEICRDTLNYLHEEFEIYGERHEQMMNRYTEIRPNQDPKIWPGTHFNNDFHWTWMKLNEVIHITESAIANHDPEGTFKSKYVFPSFSCLTHIYPPVMGELIQPADKLFLATDFNWGELYLGYNTLGKDYHHTSEDNDVRVITNGQVKVQEYFSTECWLNFGGPTRENKKAEKMFWQWYQGLDADTQELVPIDNLNALSLGKYFLGQIEYDDTFFKFHRNEDDWLNGDISLQKRWNLQVFSKIRLIEKIEIVDEPNNF